MQLYECILRLNGSLYNEVRKTDVTAAEIAVLKALHQGAEAGGDVITNIKPTKIVRREDLEERERLNNLYGGALAKREHLRSLNNILGHETVPLPQKIAGVASTEQKPRKRKVDSLDIPQEAEPKAIDQEEFA